MLWSLANDPGVLRADLDASDNCLYPIHGFTNESTTRNIEKNGKEHNKLVSHVDSQDLYFSYNSSCNICHWLSAPSYNNLSSVSLCCIACEIYPQADRCIALKYLFDHFISIGNTVSLPITQSVTKV